MTYPVRRATGWPQDPFADIQALRAQWGQMLGAAAFGLEPPVDLDQDEDGWTVTARLPGVAPEEVEIEVDDRDLYIRSGPPEGTRAAAREEGRESGIEEVIEAGGTKTPADRGEQRSIDEVIEAGAERPEPHEGGAGGTVIQPRRGVAGAAERTFNYRIGLPGDVDVDHVDAAMSHGLLTVHLPRAARPPKRRISITA